MTGGIRTHDHRDHNPGLYLLSYGHRAEKEHSRASVLHGACAGFTSARIYDYVPKRGSGHVTIDTGGARTVGKRKTKALSIGVVGVAAALLIGSAVAVAGPGKKAKSLARGVHTEISLIKANGTKDAFVVDRGQVTASSDKSVTLERKDGKSVTLGLNADTKVRRPDPGRQGRGGLLARRHGVRCARSAGEKARSASDAATVLARRSRGSGRQLRA